MQKGGKYGIFSCKMLSVIKNTVFVALILGKEHMFDQYVLSKISGEVQILVMHNI